MTICKNIFSSNSFAKLVWCSKLVLILFAGLLPVTKLNKVKNLNSHPEKNISMTIFAKNIFFVKFC